MKLYEIKTLFHVFQNRAIDSLFRLVPCRSIRRASRQTEIRYFRERYGQGDWIIALSYGKGI